MAPRACYDLTVWELAEGFGYDFFQLVLAVVPR